MGINLDCFVRQSRTLVSLAMTVKVNEHKILIKLIILNMNNILRLLKIIKFRKNTDTIVF